MKIVRKPASEVVVGEVLLLDGIPWTVTDTTTATPGTRWGFAGETPQDPDDGYVWAGRTVNGIELCLSFSLHTDGEPNICDIAEEWP